LPASRSDAGDTVSAIHIRCIGGARCCVMSVGSLVSHSHMKNMKKRLKQKAQYFIYEQKVGNLKVEIFCENGRVGICFLLYAVRTTQQFHRLCCEMLKDCHRHKYTQPLIALLAIQRLADRTQQVETRCLL